MLTAMAEVKNVRALNNAVAALMTRPANMPGLGLIYGPTGFGKTTAAYRFGVDHQAVYVRAFATWTPSSMLYTLCQELQIEPRRRNAQTAMAVCERLAETQRPLLVDEADYLIGRKDLLETIRDLHDRSQVPILLVGMDNFRRKIVNLPQFAGRVSQWVEFGPANAADARLLAKTVCEVGVADDLLEALREQTGGSMRGMNIGLLHIETLARHKRLSTVTLADWGKKAFTLHAITEKDQA